MNIYNYPNSFFVLKFDKPHISSHSMHYPHVTNAKYLNAFHYDGGNIWIHIITKLKDFMIKVFT